MHHHAGKSSTKWNHSVLVQWLTYCGQSGMPFKDFCAAAPASWTYMHTVHAALHNSFARLILGCSTQNPQFWPIFNSSYCRLVGQILFSTTLGFWTSLESCNIFSRTQYHAGKSSTKWNHVVLILVELRCYWQSWTWLSIAGACTTSSGIPCRYFAWHAAGLHTRNARIGPLRLPIPASSALTRKPVCLCERHRLRRL